ncbi:MAG: hypothetical protein A2Y57_03570 [Candidatus Woykebacteria bacterium RBG_13_40_7b]|uniref:Prolipoprotein diacylglyceryl transferase n=1 Tax=Candidatus Woykebacteria bacterium RBG_13_40_7b TaxID=1802594 RepID=A0A1G1W885_9BACT|nr:MAG: hypothetical protein A2Y57_03570 [Candidatus Woykebacteria bacterium RBG_13_40_7b]
MKGAMSGAIFRIGSVTISTFGLFLALSYIFATFLFWREGKKQGFNEEKLLDASLIILISALVGARALFVIMHPLEITDLEFFTLWKGGLSFPGAIIGSAIGSYFYCKRQKWSYLTILDLASIASLLALAISSLGLHFSGSEWGLRTNLPWAVEFIGVLGKRHPTGIYLSIFAFVIFFLVYRIYRKNPKEGLIFFLSLFLFGLSKLTVDYLKEGQNLYLSAALAIAGLSGLYFKIGRSVRQDLVRFFSFLPKRR